MSSVDMINILKKYDINTNIIKYEDLNKKKNIMDCLRDDNCIILYQTAPNYGHWVCLIVTPYEDQHILELFDPYGMVIDDELKYCDYLDDIPILTKMLFYSGLPVSYNHHKFQKRNNNIATCGCWCIARIVNKDLSLNEFYNQFKDIDDDGIAQLVRNC